MPTFDLLVVGAGGGPSEANLSGYLLKAHDKSWSDGIIGLEAGSGLGALKRILKEKPDLLSEAPGESGPTANQLHSYIRTYLITHPHLDHILSLILLAGSLDGDRKSIRGSLQCLRGIDTIFKPGCVWPNLASWEPRDPDDLYLYDPLPEEEGVYTPLHGGLSVSMLPLNHGPVHPSSAFFLKHDASEREFLFFGDVEPDHLAAKALNLDVWRIAAPKIVENILNTIFIECSWPTGRRDSFLYGHLSPPHLIHELENLAKAVVAARFGTSAGAGVLTLTSGRRRASSNASPERKRLKSTEESDVAEDLLGSLTGLRIYIIHCKEDMQEKYEGRPMHEVISEQVRTLMEERGLGATILAVEQGDLIRAWLFFES
ncbi:PDE1 [Sanghuangporus weigelae]